MIKITEIVKFNRNKKMVKIAIFLGNKSLLLIKQLCKNFLSYELFAFYNCAVCNVPKGNYKNKVEYFPFQLHEKHFVM